MTVQPALLLLGPTGAGKTPLGGALARHGLWGRPCVHFDFGEQLRAATVTGPSRHLPPSAIDVIRQVLAGGALLRDDQFKIAAAILDHFLDAHPLRQDGLLVLNGLPRHVGQARALSGRVSMQALVLLEAQSDTVHARIRADAGGDRQGRCDDSLDAVCQKLSIFRDRTLPLVNHYRDQGVTLYRIPITVRTQPADIIDTLERRGEEPLT